MKQTTLFHSFDDALITVKGLRNYLDQQVKLTEKVIRHERFAEAYWKLQEDDLPQQQQNDYRKCLGFKEDFSCENWCQLNVNGRNLTNADFSCANLKCATAIGTSFVDADFTNADLRGAILRGADFNFAEMCGADLRGADLTGATFDSADLRGARLDGAIGVPDYILQSL